MTPEETTEKLRAAFHKWLWIVEHWGWKFSMKTCECYDDMPDEADETTDAITFITWKYLEGDIYFNLKRMAKKSEEEIEEILIHELCHFLVAPVEHDKANAEISVTMIARILKSMAEAQQ